MGAPKPRPVRPLLAGLLALSERKLGDGIKAIEETHPRETAALKEKLAIPRNIPLTAEMKGQGASSLSERIQKLATPEGGIDSVSSALKKQPLAPGLRDADAAARRASRRRRDERTATEEARKNAGVLADNAARRSAQQRTLRKKMEALKEAIVLGMQEKARLRKDLLRVQAQMRDPRFDRRRALESPDARNRRLADEAELIEEELKSIGNQDDMGLQYNELVNALNGTTKEYYEALTKSASRTGDYKAVASLSRDEVCDTGSAQLVVEHVFPRIKIFGIEGFVELEDWDMQVEMFSFKANLKRMDNSANASRGTLPYGALSPEFINRYRLSPERLAELARLERNMERFFADWVKAKMRPDINHARYKQ